MRGKKRTKKERKRDEEINERKKERRGGEKKKERKRGEHSFVHCVKTEVCLFYIYS